MYVESVKKKSELTLSVNCIIYNITRSFLVLDYVQIGVQITLIVVYLNPYMDQHHMLNNVQIGVEITLIAVYLNPYY